MPPLRRSLVVVLAGVQAVVPVSELWDGERTAEDRLRTYLDRRSEMTEYGGMDPDVINALDGPSNALTVSDIEAVLDEMVRTRRELSDAYAGIHALGEQRRR